MRAVYIKMDWTALCMHALAKSMTARMTTPSQLLFLLAACAGLLLRTQAADLLDNDIMEVGSELADEDAPSISEELINSLSPDGPSYFESDIILTEDQRAAIEGENGEPFDPHEPQRAITRRENRFWSDGKVPYAISSSLGSKARSAIAAAINTYSASTCIQFYPRTSERDYVYFYKGSGCSSSVGRVGGGQRISIGSGCEHKGIVMHEILHALGRWHEQSRPDREQFITVNYHNMKNGVESNFFKLSSTQVTTQGVPYDYGSIMHYSAYAFSRNGRPTIVAKDRSVSSRVMGQRSHLSTRDLQHINALYCDSVEQASWSSWGSWTTCSRTCNGGTRSRSRTCKGGSTCPGDNYQQRTCNTRSCPVAASWSSWGSWGGCSATCGGGRQARIRLCRNGNACAGASTQFRDCNEQPCPVSPGTWSSWSLWSECSSSCDGGRQTRQRQCLSEPCEGQSSGTRSCNPHQCPTPGLRHEGCYRVVAGYGLYLLEGRVDILKGENPFQRTQAVEKCAQAAAELSFSVMGVAAGYCISGNNRVSDYKKIPSGRCRDGRGSYSNGAFYMNVYSLTHLADVPHTLGDPTVDDQDLNHSSNLITTASVVVVGVATLISLLSFN